MASPPDLPPLKVGLSRAVGGSKSVAVTSESAVLIQDALHDKLIQRAPENAVYRLDAVDGGIQLTRLRGSDEDVVGRFPFPVSFMCVDSQGLKVAKVGAGGLANSVWHRYRGILTVHTRSDGLLSVVNTVDVEGYLYGVVGSELGSTAPTEALKAQAIASRTFALKNRGRFADDGFDVDDSTRSQQYNGVDDETAATIAAVDATQGKVLTYSGGLIDAYFSTDCGGITACDTTGNDPYLQAVAESPGDGQPDYGANSPYRDWDCRFTQQQLVSLLNKDNRTKVTKFVSLSVDSYDASGRIKTATVSDDDGTMKSVTGPQLREILGSDTLKSTKVTLTVKSNGDYLFHGNGWGHGLGMSQVGAIAMASDPYNKTCEDILAHYYVGAKVSDIGDVKLPNE
jgi:stage II sporulation protein D